MRAQKYRMVRFENHNHTTFLKLFPSFLAFFYISGGLSQVLSTLLTVYKISKMVFLKLFYVYKAFPKFFLSFSQVFLVFGVTSDVQPCNRGVKSVKLLGKLRLYLCWGRCSLRLVLRSYIHKAHHNTVAMYIELISALSIHHQGTFPANF